jgi:hypothetical protein
MSISGSRLRVSTATQAAQTRKPAASSPTVRVEIQPTSPNQANYDDSHLGRLKLIRALVEVGGLSIAATRDVLASIDTPGKSLHDTLGKAQYATTPRRDYRADEQALAAALDQVDELIARRGWQIKKTSPARRLLAETVSAFHALRQDDLLQLDDYAASAERIAEADVNAILARGEIDSMLEGVVIGTVLGDTLLAALRRLAQENASASVTPQA